MTATDPRTEAIEALTVALHDIDCDPDCREELTTMGRYGRQAAVAYDAMLPLIRAAVAEEIARALEVASGKRCPECGGLAQGSRHDNTTHQNSNY